MTPATLLASPCCPGCRRVAVRVDRLPLDYDAPSPLPGAAPVLNWWPSPHAAAPPEQGYWCIWCSCDHDTEGFNEATIPTVRSLTPPAVLALIEPPRAPGAFPAEE